VPESVVRHAEQCGAVLLLAGRDYDFNVQEGGTWSWHGPSNSIEDLHPPGLLGEFQTGNAAAVLMLLEAAGLSGAVDAKLVNKVLPNVSLKGRLQRFVLDMPDSPGNEWLIDVAHNPAAAGVLAKTLADRENSGETIAIIGVLNDKDVEGIIAPLLPQVDRWIAMTPDSHRGIAANELARQISNLAGKACLVAESPAAAVESARRTASENDRILATGSFFTVSPVLEQLKRLSRTTS